MSIIDTLLGRPKQQPVQAPPVQYAPPGQTGQTRQAGGTAPSADEQAVARYRYMLQTAPPETLEQAHTEAFAKLTPEQRRLALQQLADVTPEAERGNLRDDPQSMAQAATRAEVRQPGVLERTFGGGGGMGGGMMGGGMGMGMGGMLAGGLLTSIAGSFIGSSIAHSFFDQPDVTNNFYESNPDMAGDTAGNGAGDYAQNDAGSAAQDPQDPYGDPGAADAGSDYAANDASSDFGGGEDFGGGDFGGDV
ncbi:MAG: hypothetical protein H7Y38_19510 [Armatimonadetes bacterium]|nr:hypothetical protein [Armatimonadota bacterium]